MPYQWPAKTSDLFAERQPQMVNTGLPVDDVEATRLAIRSMWPDEPGGWVHEWSRLGSRFAGEGRHDLAMLAFGWAKFPVLADNAKRRAFEHQIEQYELASAGFPVSFERRVLEVPFGNGSVQMPIHLLGAPSLPADAPVILASGGVDSWKMDLHQLFCLVALQTHARMLLFDIPGTGETAVPLSPSSTEVLGGLIQEARRLGNGRVVHLGISMGGYFSAHSGLTGSVNASVVLGGPVEAAFAPDRRWQFGMADIIGNAVGFDRPPSPEELGAKTAALSHRPLLDRSHNAPMYIINGADDVHIPQHDTLVFQGRSDTHVELIPETGHCAVSKLAEFAPAMIAWMSQHLRG